MPLHICNVNIWFNNSQIGKANTIVFKTQI